mgnify:CR=1 FL=1
MKPISERLFWLTEKLPPRLRDWTPIRAVRDKLRVREIVRRTAPLVASPRFAKRIAERGFKVVFVSPIFNSYPLLVHSLRAQTYENWELLLVHDGTAEGLDDASRRAIASDHRIHFYETDSRANDWGHTPRQFAFEKLRLVEDCDFVVVTNSDNYHVPGFTEKMLERFDESSKVVFCDMVHDYYSWRHFETRLEYSFIDCGCLMTRYQAAMAVGWRDRGYAGDWEYVRDLMDKFGREAFRKLAAPLFVHN